MKSRLCVPILALSLCGSTFAQVTQQWVSRYRSAGAGEDVASAVKVGASGAVYITGWSAYDFRTIKYSSAGDTLWTRSHSFGNDYALALVLDRAENVYVTGYSDNGSLNLYNMVKYDSGGVFQWGNPVALGTAIDIEVDALGNVYVTGSSSSDSIYTIKWNSSFIRQWGKSAGLGIGRRVELDGLGNIYVAGGSGSLGTTDIILIKYSPSGDTLWTRKYNGPANAEDFLSDLRVDSVGNAYVTGATSGNGQTDIVTVKYDAAGVRKWVSLYADSLDDLATAIDVDRRGNVFVVGQKGTGTFVGDYVTIKYDTAGVRQWVRFYNGTGNQDDWANDIVVDNAGNTYVTGQSKGIGSDYDYVTIKYDLSGAEQWVQRYNGPGNGKDIGYRIDVDNAGGVYVTGESFGGASGADYATIKYIEPTTAAHPDPYPESFFLNQNYPNPFNPNTTISYGISQASRVTLRIYDLLGQEVKTLVDELQGPGFKSIEWNSTNNLGNQVATGIYFYRIDATNSGSELANVQVKKMLILQ